MSYHDGVLGSSLPSILLKWGIDHTKSTLRGAAYYLFQLVNSGNLMPHDSTYGPKVSKELVVNE